MKFLRTVLIVLILLVIAFIAGMISPGEWLTNRQHEVQKFYHSMRFRDIQIADGFCRTPFDLKIEYATNTDGQLEAYLVNQNEVLPILHVEGTTQVGKIKHRLTGIGGDIKDIGEEGRDKIKQFLDMLGN